MRAETFLEAARAGGAEAFLATDRCDRRYLSGFGGLEGWCFIAPGVRALIVGFTELEQAREEAPGWTVVYARKRFSEALSPLVAESGIRRLGFDPERLTVAARDRLAQRLPGVELVPLPGLGTRIRMVKEPGEVEAIERAAALADAAFEHAVHRLRPGITEARVALEIEWFIRQGGGTVPFPVIVAAGPRGAMPHARPSDRRIEGGDAVVVDLGASLDGYCSDLTRTVFVSTISEKQAQVYEVVTRAQKAALEALRPGTVARDVDAVARRVIEEAGLGEFFGHGLGHGVGLDVHELPSLRPGEEEVLRPGMVFTVEPGVYLPGEFGCRVEDLVVLEESGPRLLSGAPSEPVAV